jgi:prevent-host-death family protein
LKDVTVSNRARGLIEDPAAFRPKSAGTLPEVQSSAAKTHLPQLLDEVERCAMIVITRHGRPIARLVPDPEGRQARVAEAIENMKRLAQERAERFGPVSLEEIRAWRHEGHKY